MSSAVGPLLSTLCIIVFFLMMYQEIVNILNYSLALLALPRGETEIVVGDPEEDRPFTLESVSSPRLYVMLSPVGLLTPLCRRITLAKSDPCA